MIRRVSLVLALVAVSGLSWLARSAAAKVDHLPRLPGASLLVGYAPGDLMVTIGDATLEMQTGGGNSYVLPSLSADGNLVASARYADFASTVPRALPLLTVGIYSMIEKRWRDYPSLKIQGGSVAISPDGSRLAYVTRSTAEAPPRIQFLDLKTGAVTIGPESMKNNGHITWSPDGRRIAFDRETEIKTSADGKLISPPMAIFVFDVETGIISKIADGLSPIWSPSGEWIAFYDYWPDRDNVKKGWYPANDNHVSVIHPDGTGHRVLVAFKPDESLSVPSVWSTDSESILVNKSHDPDKGTMDIYLLDLTTLKLTKKFKNAPPVFAWAAAR
jgi:dipeptidyl aminopeptidase/acylaminoacyl peptidase